MQWIERIVLLLIMLRKNLDTLLLLATVASLASLAGHPKISHNSRESLKTGSKLFRKKTLSKKKEEMAIAGHKHFHWPRAAGPLKAQVVGAPWGSRAESWGTFFPGSFIANYQQNANQEYGIFKCMIMMMVIMVMLIVMGTLMAMVMSSKS